MLAASCLTSAVAQSTEGAAIARADEDTFMLLREASRQGDAARATAYASRLPNHEFAPYVEYYRLKPQLRTASAAEVLGFLTRHNGSAIAERMRVDWLLELGRARDWNNFDQQLPLLVSADDLQLKCYALLSRLAMFCAGMTLAGVAFAAPAPQVSIKTTMGEIVVELDQEKAPKTVANFLAYVKSGFYKGTIFHRVIDGFMIQAGGYDTKLQPKRTRDAIPIESKNGLSNVTYSVAMARGDRPNSATSQFFINVADNPGLDFPGADGNGYAVFGKVVKGQEVVDKIKGVLVDDKPGFENVPVIPIVIESAKVVKAVK